MSARSFLVSRFTLLARPSHQKRAFVCHAALVSSLALMLMSRCGDALAGYARTWGLQGMRERAQHIRARLNIVSRVGAGTTIELVVPAALAYDTGVRFRRDPIFAGAG
jgi:Signal transduction histidine kinase